MDHLSIASVSAAGVGGERQALSARPCVRGTTGASVTWEENPDLSSKGTLGGRWRGRRCFALTKCAQCT